MDVLNTWQETDEVRRDEKIYDKKHRMEGNDDRKTSAPLSLDYPYAEIVTLSVCLSV